MTNFLGWIVPRGGRVRQRRQNVYLGLRANPPAARACPALTLISDRPEALAAHPSSDKLIIRISDIRRRLTRDCSHNRPGRPAGRGRAAEGSPPGVWAAAGRPPDAA